MPRENQIARTVLVVWVRLDQLIGGHGRQDHLAGNEPADKPHVHVVRPEDSFSTDAVLDESNRVIRKPALRDQSRVSVRPQLDSPNIVFDAGPATTDDGVDRMPGEDFGEVYRELLVKKSRGVVQVAHLLAVHVSEYTRSGGIRTFLIRGARDRHARAPRAAGSRRAWSGSRLLRARSRHEY